MHVRVYQPRQKGPVQVCDGALSGEPEVVGFDSNNLAVVYRRSDAFVEKGLAVERMVGSYGMHESVIAPVS